MATSTIPHPHSERHRAVNIAFWVAQVVVAAFLISAGIPKLTGNPTMIQVFDTIGMGQWFRYLTGALEVGGSVGLLIPRDSGYAALLLAAVMTGAIVTHIAILGGSFLVPLILLAVLLAIARFRLGDRV
jgi:putative oxidoreductase